MTLPEMSLCGAVMTGAVLVIQALGRRVLPQRTFPILWGLVTLRLLAPFTLPLPFSLPGSTPSVPLSDGGVPAILPTVVYAAEGAFPAAVPEKVLLSGPPLWVWIWAVGTVLWAGYFLLVFLRCLREFRTALPVENVYARDCLSQIPLGFRRIELRQSDRLSVPLTYGVLRPVILLPASLDWEDTRTLAHILTHEAVHVRHWDALTKLLLAAAFALHWWNPAVWVLFRCANRDLELACDEESVERLGRAFGASAGRDYARTLLRMEERRNLSLFSSFSCPNLERRIRAIMKWKKTTIPALLAAALLVTGMSAAFVTPAEPAPLPTGSLLTQEEYDRLSALRLEGYERMTVAQFQDRIWTLTDTPEDQALLDRLVSDETLCARRDSQELAGFWFYILCPLINDQWPSRQFDGAVQTGFRNGPNALIEYTLTLTILDRDHLTVGQYAKAREDIARNLQDFLDRRTSPAGLEDAVAAECRTLEDALSTETLELDLAFVVQNQEIPAAPVPEGQEPRAFPNGTPEDYRSLLALRTPGYQALSLRAFNQTLLDWANEDYERMERINTDIARNDFQAALTAEELAFLQWTVRLSGEENGRLVRSHYTGRPEEDPQYGGVQLEKSDGLGTWCTLWYQVSYHITDKDSLTVGERDRAVSGFVQAVHTLFYETPLSELVTWTEADAALQMDQLAERHSTALLTLSTGTEQIQFEHDIYRHRS